MRYYYEQHINKLESLRPRAVIWCLRGGMCAMDLPALPCGRVQSTGHQDNGQTTVKAW